MDNIVINQKLILLTQWVNEIRLRMPDPRRYPSAIALLQAEAHKLKVAAAGGRTWAGSKAEELNAALRVLGGDPAR